MEATPSQLDELRQLEGELWGEYVCTVSPVEQEYLTYPLWITNKLRRVISEEESGCPRCDGTGWYVALPRDRPKPCVVCNGTGKIQEYQ